jgi:hypothetical protein
MQPGDWFDAVSKIIIGMCVGIAVSGLARLFAIGYWPVAVAFLIGVAAIFFLDGALDRVFERLLPSGIRPAPKPAARGSKPIVLLASLPVGIVIGVILDQLGLADAILSLL